MRLDVAGKRVVVTGGTRGIGRTISLAFAQAGAQVVAVHRSDTTAAAELARVLKEMGGDHRVVRADLTDRAEIAELVDDVRTALGGVDVLVNNAGVDGHERIEQLAPEEWHRVLDGDLTTLFLVTQAFLPLLDDAASVVNVGAAVGLRGFAGRAHYTAAKAGVIGLTRSLCKEFGPRGLRFNTVAPGVIATDPPEELPPPLLARVRAMTALGRLGTPDDVAGAVLYLASDLARYVTGTTLNVDGGI